MNVIRELLNKSFPGGNLIWLVDVFYISLAQSCTLKRSYKIIPTVLLVLASCSTLRGQIVINEISQGPTGGKEYVEFLVLGTPCTSTCLDLRLWVFDDNNGFLNGGPTTGVGIASGACRFANDPFWSCIPSGTLITIYNDLDQNSSLPPDDLLMTDNNCNLVIPINSTLFDHHSTEPNSTNSTYPTAGWIAGGAWIDISMANTQDGFQIYNPADLTTPVFSVGWGPANVNGDIWMGAGSATDDVFYADNSIDCDFTNQGNWAEACAGDIPACGSDDQTPGAANSAGNAVCISTFNNGCTGGPPLIIDSIVGVNISCFGVCDGSATAYVSGGTTPYTYAWNDPLAQTDSVANGLCAGTFTVTVTEAGGCQDTLDSVVIIEPLLITSAITASTNPVCFGDCTGSATVTPGGGSIPYTYAWNDPGLQTTPTATGLCAGTYDV
ncbi:MAG: SprB repeat-containing protein, partial [Flavobacteriales bacterium]|nr:SprB repeat-containing protein [Flavobacteriales bacterium]